MKLGKYIQNLLQENETVIVPGFGAFVSVYKSAEIDEQSGEIIPPSKAISFNPKIRNNDGLLVDAVSDKEGISHFEALKKIENERDEIIYQLDKGEKVKLEKLGVLFLGENSEILLDPSEEKKLLLDSFGLEKTSLKDEPEPVPDEKPEEEKETETNSDEELPEEEDSETGGAEREPETESEAADFSGTLSDEPDEPKKKKRGWLWFLLIIISLIVAGIYIFFKDDIVKEQPPVAETIVEEPPAEELPGREKISEPIQAADVDSTQTDSMATAPADSLQIPEQTIDSTHYIKPDTAMFYLVGGSFKKAKNANEYFMKLENEGYEPFHLGKQGSFYIVGIDIFDNEIEAYGAQYNFLDKYPDSGVWVFIPE